MAGRPVERGVILVMAVELVGLVGWNPFQRAFDADVGGAGVCSNVSVLARAHSGLQRTSANSSESHHVDVGRAHCVLRSTCIEVDTPR